jgi:hypothetical protein
VAAAATAAVEVRIVEAAAVEALIAVLVTDQEASEEASVLVAVRRAWPR